jgi:hypothetical protein
VRTLTSFRSFLVGIFATIVVYPGLEPAFYATALILNSFEAAFALAPLVFSKAAHTPS